MLLQGLRIHEENITSNAEVLRTCGRGGQEWRAAIINLWPEQFRHSYTVIPFGKPFLGHTVDG
jgi:hypothetical protein